MANKFENSEVADTAPSDPPVPQRDKRATGNRLDRQPSYQVLTSGDPEEQGRRLGNTIPNGVAVGKIYSQVHGSLSKLSVQDEKSFVILINHLDGILNQTDELSLRFMTNIFRDRKDISEIREAWRSALQDIDDEATWAMRGQAMGFDKVEDIDEDIFNNISGIYRDLFYTKFYLRTFLSIRLKNENPEREIPISERLAHLLAYSQRNGDRGLKELARTLLPEWSIDVPGTAGKQSTWIELPQHAPELYAGLRSAENPPEFVKRVYRPWLGQGLTRAHIRELDPGLYRAIDNWSRKPGNDWPADVDLPTLKEQNSRLLKEITETGELPAATTMAEARRLVGAQKMRIHRETREK